MDDIYLGLDYDTGFKSQDQEYGLCGLTNIGNTCYMNSALQCFFSHNVLTDYMLRKKFKDDLYDNMHKLLKSKNKDTGLTLVSTHETTELIKKTVTYNLYRLFRNVWNTNQEIEPKEFKKAIGRKNKIFAGHDQNDSQEFLSFMLDQIHEELKTKCRYKTNIPEKLHNFIKQYEDLIKNEEELNKLIKNNKKDYIMYLSVIYWVKYVKDNSSIVTDLFTGLFYNDIVCGECNTHSHVFEPFNILSLAIPNQNSTLEECISNFTITESLTGENQYKCEKCNKLVDATKTCYIWNVPSILVIQLKRFSMNPIDKILNRKNNTFISYPFVNLNINGKNMDLYSVIQHMGGLGGGHYISNAKNPINDKWYEFNDNSVTRVTDVSQIVSSNSYILFYKSK